ncbi:MAG: PHP domain-containing protein [Candidatus Zixiibacteriota bacterium]
MPSCIDLHLHTSRSDGVLSPRELLEEVRARKLVAFAVVDHDTIDGYRELADLIVPGDPELVSGLELSVATGNGDMHLLAYLFDSDHQELAETLETFREARNLRGRQMVERLNQQGLRLPFETVLEAAGGSAIGRPHIAEALVKNGLASSIEETFRKYIGNNCPAYIPKSMIRPPEAIALIHRAGGVAVLAHPYINDMHRHVPSLVRLGLDGLEIHHYSHDKQQVQELKRLAQKHGLLLSGGSDFHGRQEHEGDIGADSVPVEYLEKLKSRALEIRGGI